MGFSYEILQKIRAPWLHFPSLFLYALIEHPPLLCYNFRKESSKDFTENDA